MKLDAWEQPANFPALEGGALQEALEELCERRQGLFLATPYLTFASRFLGRDGQALRIRATMSRTVAQHTLVQKPLTLRFPWGPTLYGGATRVLDYVQDEAGKHLKLALPTQLVRVEQRGAWRAERVGRTQGTLGGQDAEGQPAFVRFNIENLSTSGLGVFCLDPLPGPAFAPGRKVAVEFTLDHGPDLKGTAQIIHMNGQTLGLAFNPPLEGMLREHLALWLQPRLDEEFRRWDGRAALRARAERAAAPRPAPAGILLVSSDAGIIQEVAEALAGAQDVRTAAPVMAPYRDALEQNPPCLVLLPCTGGLDECHRLKALLEKAHPPCPLVVLNTGDHPEAVRTFAQDIKATLATDRPRLRPVFFRRLVVGLIRKHWNNNVS